MSKLWFMPATPVLSNDGTTRGLAILKSSGSRSCDYCQRSIMSGVHRGRLGASLGGVLKLAG